MNDWDIKTIVLGYDGSEGADKAVELASTLARQNGARILVVNAYKVEIPDTDGYRWGESKDEARDLAQEAVGRLQAAGVEAEPEVLDGPAEDALLQAAESHDADLIVVGRRGHGLIAGLLLGSTSEYVVRRAKVPVLVAH
jgi:nucleotide-binding universal stress UspA family protein